MTDPVGKRGTSFAVFTPVMVALLVGKAFGPIMLIWFATMAMLGGIVRILRHPQVLGALNPIHGLRLFGKY